MMSDATEVNPAKPIVKAQRFRLRWSLRVLIAVVTLACVLFAWLGSVWHMGHVHDDVGARLMGIVHDAQHPVSVQWSLTKKHTFTSVDGSTTGTFHRKEGPPWMRDSRTELFWQRIQSITLDSDTMSQEELELASREIARLDRLDELTLKGPQIREEHTARMVEWVQVDRLDASEMEVGTGRLAWLRGTRLKELSLRYTQFSNPAIDDLPDTLTFLNLSGTRVNDEGLSKLARLRNLERLRLWQTNTSEEAIETLQAQMPWCDIA